MGPTPAFHGGHSTCVSGKHEPLEQPQGLVVADPRSRAIAHVRFRCAALHHGQALEAPGEFALKVRVVARVLRDPVQVLDGPIEQQLPRRRRARQVVQGIVHIEDERVRQFLSHSHNLSSASVGFLLILNALGLDVLHVSASVVI